VSHEKEVKIMDQTTKLDPRLIWGAVAAALVAIALWAGSALAADGSSTSSDSNSTGNTPVQTAPEGGTQAAPDGGGQEAPRGDCPEGGPQGAPQDAPDSSSYGGGYPAESFSAGI
jgi:hypothetical protein